MQHYEETHVKIEEAEDEGISGNGASLDLDALIAADSLLNVGATDARSGKQATAQTPVPFHIPTPVSASTRLSTPVPKRSEQSTMSPNKKRTKILTLGIETCDFVGNDLSAFDNTVIRPIDATRFDQSLLAFNGHHGYARIAPKRSQSVPAIPNLPLIKGEHNFKFIQSILSSTVDPPTGENSHTNFNTTPKPVGHYSQQSTSSVNVPSYYHSSRGNSDRPFVCPVTGCGKTYKNANGLKYHAIHGHDGVLVEKPHKCPFAGCGKRYKNSNGLKYHFQHAHPNALPPSASMNAHIPPRSNSIPPIRSAPSLKQADSGLLSASNTNTIAELIKSNPMVKQHLPAILRNLQQMAIQRANSDRKPPSN